jgi:histidyl-tRNA synthetase
METAGVSGPDEANVRLSILRSIDKLHRVGMDGVQQLLQGGRKDESGDFAKGAGLSDHQASIVLGFLKASIGKAEIRSRGGSGNFAFSNDLREMLSTSVTGTEGVNELIEIANLTSGSGYQDGRILIDPSVVRGLEYYTGPVYEVELTLETKDEKGRPVRFGSVGGGGRYDGLVSRFRGEPVPATGFSIGVSRLQAALTMLGKLDTAPELGPVVVTVFDRDHLADYQKLVAMLRDAKIRAELYLGNPKSMSNQLKYADRRNSPCVIIQGSDERNDPEGPQVIVKDLLVGSTVTGVEKDRDRYLQTHRAIQKKVPVSELVGAVQEILNWHGIVWK